MAPPPSTHMPVAAPEEMLLSRAFKSLSSPSPRLFAWVETWVRMAATSARVPMEVMTLTRVVRQKMARTRATADQTRPLSPIPGKGTQSFGSGSSMGCPARALAYMRSASAIWDCVGLLRMETYPTICPFSSMGVTLASTQ